MTVGWKPWEIDAVEQSTMAQLADYLVRTGVFAAPAASASVPGDGEEPDDDDTHIHATLERAAMRFD